MENIALLVGGRSTEHDASIHSYLGIVDDYLMECPEDVHISAVYYLTHGGDVYIHRIDESAEFPDSESGLRSGEQLTRIGMLSHLLQSGAYTFSLLHGSEGEDGGYQGLAEVLDIPGNFGSVFASCIGMHKWTQALIAVSVLRPHVREIDTLLVHSDSDADVLADTVARFSGRHCVLKPNSMGASLLARSVEELTVPILQAYLREVAPFDMHTLVQERVFGTEYTCGCLRTPQRLVTLPVIEAATREHFLGHAEKHSAGGVIPILHSDSAGTVGTIQMLSASLFEWMSYSDMCRFDFMVDHAGGIYFLEANTLPGLMRGSAYPKMLAAAGYRLIDLLKMSVANYRHRSRRNKLLRYDIAE